MVSSILVLICGMTASSLMLNFAALGNGQLGISSVYGSFLAEAASHCLRCKNHVSPVVLDISGDTCTSSFLSWRDASEVDEETWADLQEATEYGAYGVAIVVALTLTGTARVERSAKGTGVDYWLGDGKDEIGIFQRTARLEVSGILEGGKAKIAGRLKEKLIQTNRSESTELPGYVAIVEFGAPEASLVRATSRSDK
jgi:hypothetical protein